MAMQTSLITVRLEVSGCRDGEELRRIGGALACIRGVACAEPAADGRHLTVSYDTGRVLPVQFERAVRAMGGRLDRIAPHF